MKIGSALVERVGQGRWGLHRPGWQCMAAVAAGNGKGLADYTAFYSLLPQTLGLLPVTRLYGSLPWSCPPLPLYLAQPWCSTKGWDYSWDSSIFVLPSYGVWKACVVLELACVLSFLHCQLSSKLKTEYVTAIFLVCIPVHVSWRLVFAYFIAL